MLNVVLISVESLSAEYLGKFGNTRGLTPNLDRIADEGLLFTGLYATGTRTVRGLEAVTLAIPPTPGQSIVRRPHNETLFSLGSVFEDKGYGVLFAYGGWQSTNFVAAELKAPRRDLPRALVIGVGIVVLAYVLANVVYVRVLGIAGLAASTAPASDVMRGLLGNEGATFIALGIAVSTFGFLNLAILSAPRVYQAMAADGVFFGGAARLSHRSRVPALAILIQGGWAMLLVATKTYGQLLDYVVFGDWIFFAAVGVTVFVYRRRGEVEEAGEAASGTAWGGFRCPGYPWVPGFFVAAGGFAVVSTVLSNPVNALVGGGIIAVGIPVYLWWKRRGP